MWKMANIILIKKLGQLGADPTSYRPISLLSSLGKVVEKTIKRTIQNTANDLGIVPHEQMGFREGHSTTHQGVRLTTTILKAANHHQKTGVVFLDISKAFDKMWHEGLVLKMLHHGFPKYQVELVESFLRDRTFRVTLDGTISTERTIKAGVPQGSCLSPLLFNIYMADIPQTRTTELLAYADDTAIAASSRTKWVVIRRLQKHLDSIADWMDR